MIQWNREQLEQFLGVKPTEVKDGLHYRLPVPDGYVLLQIRVQKNLAGVQAESGTDFHVSASIQCNEIRLMNDSDKGDPMSVELCGESGQITLKPCGVKTPAFLIQFVTFVVPK